MKIYESIYKPKKKIDPKITKLNSIRESLKQLKKQLREDDNISLDPNEDKTASVETVINKVEDALIDAIKTLGATNEITGQLIDTVSKIEGQGAEEPVTEDAPMDDFAIAESGEDSLESINREKGYNDENVSNMKVDMSEEGDIIGVNGEPVEGSEKEEDEDIFASINDEGSEKAEMTSAEEGVTPFTQYTDEEELLDESEEMDREDNARKTGQYQLPNGKVDEDQPGLSESKVKRCVRRFSEGKGKESNGRTAFKKDKVHNSFYIEKEDGGMYSVYGGDTGFCYLFDGTKDMAQKKLDELKA